MKGSERGRRFLLLSIVISTAYLLLWYFVGHLPAAAISLCVAVVLALLSRVVSGRLLKRTEETVSRS